MTRQQKLPMINVLYVTFSPTYFLRLTYKLVYINAQRWPKVTTDVCKCNRPLTVYGSIEKTLLDNWCGFVTIDWINRSFKWIMGIDRQQHMNWTAFWWQSQRAHDRWASVQTKSVPVREKIKYHQTNCPAKFCPKNTNMKWKMLQLF